MRPAVRSALIASLVTAGLCVASRAEAAPQEDAVIQSSAALEAAIRAADGVVRFEFAARPGVWGDGRTWNFSRDVEAGGRPASSRHWRCKGSTNGPIRVTVRVRGGAETNLHSQVGGDWPEPGRDLGTVAPEAAADYLLTLVERSGPEPDAGSKEDALQAAVSAPAGEIWPRILDVAKDRRQNADVRKAALFWTAHEASVRAADDIEAIAVATDEEAEVQEAAVFALTQLPEDRGTEALLRLARGNRNPDVVRSVYFWLGQRDDPRVVALFEEVLLD